MKVYHGTSERFLNRISQMGIMPRKLTGNSNFKHSIESHPGVVYLTNAYAVYFGLGVVNQVGEHFERIAILEVDTDLLEPAKLVADEDALEQMSRHTPGGDGLPPGWSMKQRTRYYRDNLKRYAKNGFGFEWSLSVLGTGGHFGPVPRPAITRVALIDMATDNTKRLCWKHMNPTISVQNYHYCAGSYMRDLYRIFGEPLPEKARNEIVLAGIEQPVGPQGITVLDWSLKP